MGRLEPPPVARSGPSAPLGSLSSPSSPPLRGRVEAEVRGWGWGWGLVLGLGLGLGAAATSTH